jgi:DNA-binding response OmpR family regulator
MGQDKGLQRQLAGASSEWAPQVQPRVLLSVPLEVDLSVLQQFLSSRHCAITRCVRQEELPRRAADLQPHLIVIAGALLLDLLDMCREARRVSQAPILVLGQRDAEEDEVLCLEYGADTYLVPGVSPRRLQAHAAALLHRGLTQVHARADAFLTVGEIRLDVLRQRVWRGRKQVDLSQKEYALLRFLIEHAGRAVTRQTLTDSVWGAGATNDNRTLDVHIHWLREKLEVDASNPKVIRTVRGVGYCLEAE